MHRLYGGVGMGIIALGILHVAAATRIYPSLTQAALWFASGGLLMALTGAVNLLNRRYGSTAPGLRRVCVATNLAMTAFALCTGLVGGAATTELIVVVGLFAGASVMASLSRGLSPRFGGRTAASAPTRQALTANRKGRTSALDNPR
jgi:hypothetical protein